MYDTSLERRLNERHPPEQEMVEPASSVGLAAMLSGKIEVQDRKVVLVITSRNIDESRTSHIISEHGNAIALDAKRTQPNIIFDMPPIRDEY